MASKKKKVSPVVSSDFESLVTKIVQIHDRAQDFSTKAVNIGLTLRNWLIGHRIVEFEQNGKDRATYGERLLPKLAQRLVNAGLKRVDARELRRFRLLYTVYPQIRETVSPELLAQSGIAPLMMFLHSDSSRESATPQLIPSEPGLLDRLVVGGRLERIGQLRGTWYSRGMVV
jgi:hypothetical protein